MSLFYHNTREVTQTIGKSTCISEPITTKTGEYLAKSRDISNKFFQNKTQYAFYAQYTVRTVFHFSRQSNKRGFHAAVSTSHPRTTGLTFPRNICFAYFALFVRASRPNIHVLRFQTEQQNESGRAMTQRERLLARYILDSFVVKFRNSRMAILSRSELFKQKLQAARQMLYVFKCKANYLENIIIESFKAKQLLQVPSTSTLIYTNNINVRKVYIYALNVMFRISRYYFLKLC